jgi:hypothetical protein
MVPSVLFKVIGSREAEKQRSREAEKQRSREAISEKREAISRDARKQISEHVATYNSVVRSSSS